MYILQVAIWHLYQWAQTVTGPCVILYKASQKYWYFIDYENLKDFYLEKKMLVSDIIWGYEDFKMNWQLDQLVVFSALCF